MNTTYQLKVVVCERFAYAKMLLGASTGQTTYKIVAHTLMMSWGTTLTSEIFRYTAADAFSENDVFRLRADDQQPEINIAAVGWLCSTDDVRVAHIICGERAVTEIAAKSNASELWLLACHTAWQVDNAVSRRCKLWTALQRRGIDRPSGRAIEERCIATSSGIKWYSAVQFPESDYALAMRIVHEEPASLIVAGPAHFDEIIDNIVRATWARPQIGPPSNVLSTIVTAHGLLMWPVGAFDDQEAGIAVFGAPPDIQALS